MDDAVTQAVTAHSDGLNLAEYFVDRNVAGGRGGRTALLTPSGPCTYAQLAELVNCTGNALLELGVRRGQRVLLALADSVEFVAAWYAAQKIGAVTAEVYTFLQPKDYAYHLAYTEAPVVVVDATTLAPIREAATLSGASPLLLAVACPPPTLRHGEVSFTDITGRQSAHLDAAPAAPDDIAIWKFTTGSTGKPKACVHPVHSAVDSYEAYAKGVLGVQPDDVVLPVPKLFFGYARDLAALYPFGAGAAGIIFPERTTPEIIFDLIARHRPSILVNVPTMMQAMLDHPDAANHDLSCLRACTAAGEALPPPLHRRWLDTFGVEVLDGMGSSEAYHIYISNHPGRARVGSIGEAVPGYRIDIVDEAGAELPDGETGRIWIHGDTCALMYHGDETRSRETFAPRLVMSGDLAMRDGEGYFWYRGRADDLLKVGGIWVAPAEIEACLAGHPGVAEAAVVGVEREGLVRCCAFTVARPGAALDPPALQAFVRAHLSPHKTPAEVHVLQVLPRTGSGKVDRQALRSIAASQQPQVPA